jgi:hypothetical protein
VLGTVLVFFSVEGQHKVPLVRRMGDGQPIFASQHSMVRSYFSSFWVVGPIFVRSIWLMVNFENRDL